MITSGRVSCVVAWVHHRTTAEALVRGADVPPLHLREIVSGRWQKTTSASGVLIRLIADLTYQILDSANQPVCGATYGAIYTRSQ
jgi:hypothetical protein